MLLVWFNLYHKKIFHESFAPNRTQEKWSSGFLTRSDTNLSVQSQKKARSLKYQIYVEFMYTIPGAKTKVLISCAVTAQLICIKNRVFFYDAAQIVEFSYQKPKL